MSTSNMKALMIVSDLNPFNCISVLLLLWFISQRAVWSHTLVSCYWNHSHMVLCYWKRHINWIILQKFTFRHLKIWYQLKLICLLFLFLLMTLTYRKATSQIIIYSTISHSKPLFNLLKPTFKYLKKITFYSILVYLGHSEYTMRF